MCVRTQHAVLIANIILLNDLPVWSRGVGARAEGGENTDNHSYIFWFTQSVCVSKECACFDDSRSTSEVRTPNKRNAFLKLTALSLCPPLSLFAVCDKHTHTHPNENT